MDATCAIQASIHVFSLVRKYVSRILGTYQIDLRGFFYMIGNCVLTYKNAPRGCALGAFFFYKKNCYWECPVWAYSASFFRRTLSWGDKNCRCFSKRTSSGFRDARYSAGVRCRVERKRVVRVFKSGKPFFSAIFVRFSRV